MSRNIRNACSRKIKHKDEQSALVSMYAAHSGHAVRLAPFPTPYHCSVCDAWHWGHAAKTKVKKYEQIHADIAAASSIAQVNDIVKREAAIVMGWCKSKNRTTRLLGIKIQHLARYQRMILR